MRIIDKLFESQPAHLMYAFDGGWKVMEYVWSNVFARTDVAARTWFDLGHKWELSAIAENNNLLKYWKFCLFAGSQLAGFSQYFAAMLIVSVFLLLQFILLVVWVFTATLAIAILMIFNFLYSYYYKIFFRCPTCYKHMPIPLHICPRCATVHSRLWPSIYGVFYHRCKACNTKLPTLDTLGRRHLIRKCTNCERPMNKKVGELINIHVPIIGGPSTGKSNYIFMATRELIDSYALPRSYTVEFPDERDEQEYKKYLKELSLGRVLEKTPDITPQAYNLALKRPGDRIGKILYIYDAAGEAYATEDHTLLQKYYDYVDGLIFVIDPFSIDLYRRAHEREVNALRTALRPSGLSVMDGYERMITVLEGSIGPRSRSRFKQPIAVVISKGDALDLEARIGRSAAQKLMRSDPTIRLEEDAINLLVEQFLIEYEMGNLIRDLHLQFEQVRFFSCSALGRMPDERNHRPFVPVGVLEPLLWVLGTLKVVNATQERAQNIDNEHQTIAQAQGNFLASAKYYYWDSLKPRP